MTKTVLLAWELGGELGHLSNLHGITQGFIQQGMHVVIALQDVSRAHQFFPANDKIRLLQAPVWLPKIHMQRPVACLADILLLKGYLKAEPLAHLIHLWQSLFQLVKPDVLICDYAPTAMLASVQADFHRLVVGTGFSDPVPQRPLLDWRPNQPDDGLIATQEQVLLHSIHTALAGSRTFDYYGDIFACEGTFISTLPPLDLYPDRPHATYGIQPARPVNATPIHWHAPDTPHSSLPRIIAYLKPHYPHLTTTLQALRHVEAEVFVACPGGAPNTLSPFTTDRLTISTQVVDLWEAFPSADLFIGHGNMGSTAQSLLHGVPVLSLPRHLENQLTTQKLVDLQVGACLDIPLSTSEPTSESAVRLSQTITSALSNSALRANAQALGERSAPCVNPPLNDQIVSHCMGLLV